MACGDAPVFGGLATAPNLPIVGIAATPDGAATTSSCRTVACSHSGMRSSKDRPARRLNEPVVGIAVDAATGGYWLVATDGGIFAYNAPFYGSTGSLTLNRPVVGLAESNGGSGYWLVASDGGIFAYNAPFWGSTAGFA